LCGFVRGAVVCSLVGGGVWEREGGGGEGGACVVYACVCVCSRLSGFSSHLGVYLVSFVKFRSLPPPPSLDTSTLFLRAPLSLRLSLLLIVCGR